MGAVQENPNAIPEGETPHSVTMLCFDEMVDTAKPGDRVTVTGIYKAVPMRVKPRMRMLKSIYKTHIDILHVQRDEKSRLFSVAQDQAAADAAATDEAPAPVRVHSDPCRALQKSHRCSQQHAPVRVPMAWCSIALCMLQHRWLFCMAQRLFKRSLMDDGNTGPRHGKEFCFKVLSSFRSVCRAAT